MAERNGNCTEVMQKGVGPILPFTSPKLARLLQFQLLVWLTYNQTTDMVLTIVLVLVTIPISREMQQLLILL